MSTALAVQNQTPMFALSTMQEALEFSTQMAKAKLLPVHLQNSPSDCLRVVMQATRWEMDPFSVAEKTSVISGKLMYEGQLVTAVVNSRGKMSKRLSYSFKGEGDARCLTVSGTIEGETEARTIELPFSLAKRINKNGQMNTNPDQQACYIGARLWARRHMPELMMGVYTPDEIDPDELENVTPGAAPAESDEARGAGARARREAPARNPKGAAAISPKPEEKKPEQQTIDIDATIPRAETSKPAPAETKAPEANATVEDDFDSSPAREEIVITSLKSEERVKVKCKFVKLSAEMKTKGGQPVWCVFAELDGGFRGSATDLDGSHEVNGTVVPKSPLYKEGGWAYVSLIGKERKTGVNAGTVGIIIEKVEAAP